MLHVAFRARLHECVVLRVSIGRRRAARRADAPEQDPSFRRLAEDAQSSHSRRSRTASTVQCERLHAAICSRVGCDPLSANLHATRTSDSRHRCHGKYRVHTAAGARDARCPDLGDGSLGNLTEHDCEAHRQQLSVETRRSTLALTGAQGRDECIPCHSIQFRRGCAAGRFAELPAATGVRYLVKLSQFDSAGSARASPCTPIRTYVRARPNQSHMDDPGEGLATCTDLRGCR